MPSAVFLDRDGVINARLPGDYVRSPQSFALLPRAAEAITRLGEHFEHVLVVTNQAGVGKGLMTDFDLRLVHIHLEELAAAAGGRIDGIFHCPHRSDAGCFCRKPLTGMAWQALAKFPDIDFANSWMVGDSASDIRFGQALGMRTVLIEGKEEDAAALATLGPHFRFASLWDFACFW
jgi:D-glycero-D-manno-heptose 1,7-bisphosphate phosphatase